jgi:hypothetical protein
MGQPQMTTDMVEVELVLVTCLMSPYTTWYWNDVHRSRGRAYWYNSHGRRRQVLEIAVGQILVEPQSWEPDTWYWVVKQLFQVSCYSITCAGPTSIVPTTIVHLLCVLFHIQLDHSVYLCPLPCHLLFIVPVPCLFFQ